MRIAELAEQYPSQISGGQQQRVALARAIVAGGDVVLFDEPLSNIDARVRIDLRAEILAMQQELGFTAVYVTHDQEEAMALASRIAVLDRGRIVQCGSPEEIYHRPESYHVAQVVGTINELAGVVTEVDGAQAVLDTALGPVRVAAPSEDVVGRSMVAVSRPERWQISTTEPSTPNRWKGMVDDVHFVGSRVEYRVEVLGHRLRAWTFSPAVVDLGAHVWVSAGPEGLTLLTPPDPTANGGVLA
jgi:iron(III) transport system ATP-binding protein